MTIDGELVLSAWPCYCAQKLFDVSLGAAEHLHLGTDGQVAQLAALLHEKVEEVLSLLCDCIICLARHDLTRDRRDVQTGVPRQQALAELFEVRVPAETLYGSERVLSIDGVCVVTADCSLV